LISWRSSEILVECVATLRLISERSLSAGCPGCGNVGWVGADIVWAIVPAAGVRGETGDILWKDSLPSAADIL